MTANNQSRSVVLSVIIPTYNEEKYIAPLIDSLLIPDGIDKEIFFADGMSTDRTREIIQQYQSKHPNIYLVDNPKRFVSPGFNQAFRQSNGKYVTLMGAHATYPKGFFSAGIKYLSAGECDVVGGPLRQEGKTPDGKAIALAMSSKLGVGGTEFRTERKKMYVDSVAFAIYKREIFETIGLLDEDLVRNQDDELHYRMNAAGYRILMVPEMECVYYVRNSLSALYKQYYQYGYYKPLVLKKVRQGIRLRHLVPATFCLYLLSVILLVWFVPIWILPLIIYIITITFTAVSANIGFRQKIIFMAAFPTLHLSYGFGFLNGLVHKK